MMNNKRRWLVDIEVYLLWFAVVALGFWLALQMRISIDAVMIVLYVKGDVWRVPEADVADKVAFAILICAWIVGIILIESYLRKGAPKQALLMERFARVFGPGLLALSLVDLFNLLILGNVGGVWWQWLVVAGELLAGVVIIRYGKFLKKRRIS